MNWVLRGARGEDRCRNPYSSSFCQGSPGMAVWRKGSWSAPPRGPSGGLHHSQLVPAAYAQVGGTQVQRSWDASPGMWPVAKDAGCRESPTRAFS